MAIENRPIFYAVCDKCGDSIGSPLWIEWSMAHEGSASVGWKTETDFIFCPICWPNRWEIDAVVKDFVLYKNRVGYLILENKNETQFLLDFTKAPIDIETIKGLKIWGFEKSLLVKKCTFAKRIGFKKIEITCENFNWCKR